MIHAQTQNYFPSLAWINDHAMDKGFILFCNERISFFVDPYFCVIDESCTFLRLSLKIITLFFEENQLVFFPFLQENEKMYRIKKSYLSKTSW